MSDTLNSSTDDQNYIEFKNNPTRYLFKLSLVTTDNRYREIKPAQLKTLVINDSIQDPFHSGYIVLDNKFDILERNVEGNVSTSSSQYYDPLSQSQQRGFLFKGDCRDILHVEIMPNLTKSTMTSNDSTAANTFFKLLFDFVIYDSEEILEEEPGCKYKKLYFYDLCYEILKEKNVAFSTANYISGGDIASLSDEDRGIKTGTAIKEFISTVYNSDDKYTVNAAPDFEEGSTNIFFSAPVSYKALDTLHYLLSRHVASADSNYDTSIFQLERYPRQFSLYSIKNYFDKAYIKGSGADDKGGDNFLETLKIGGYSNVDNTVTSTMTVEYAPKYAMFLDKFGTISNFSFDNMPGQLTQQELVSIDVHSYSYRQHQFQIDSYNNDVTEALSTYKANYVNQMKGENGDTPYINFQAGQYRVSRKNIKSEFSTTSDDSIQRLNMGRNSFLYKSLFLNHMINFRLPGSTHRQAGKFIAITREDAMAISEFDNKLLGIYFVVEVKHIFTDGQYFTDMRCVKTYNYSDVFITGDSV